MEPNVEYTQGERLTIQLTRPDSSQSWGFRLQGGVDFSTPLSLQVVQPNSVAEFAGLLAGDGILFINNTNTDGLSHEQAKMEIIRSSNDITLAVLRGAVKVWKPLVTPMSELRPAHLNTIQTATGEEITPVQRTSLQMKQPEALKIEGFNRSARGFAAGGNRVPDNRDQAASNVVHAQFNSPIDMYSPGNIADTYHTQTAGIQSQMNNMNVGNMAAGTYQDNRNQPQQQSAQYQDTAPGEEIHYHGYANPNVQSRTFLLLQDELDRQEHDKFEKGDVEVAACDTEPDTNPSGTPAGMEVGSGAPAGFRSVTAPITQPPDPAKLAKQESMRCGECDMLVTGVFVRVKGIPYHVNCFKCATCQINLKQKGYFVIEGKLYCDIHAKRATQAPAPNMVATAVYR